jgi:hypothetical protein
MPVTASMRSHASATVRTGEAVRDSRMAWVWAARSLTGPTTSDCLRPSNPPSRIKVGASLMPWCRRFPGRSRHCPMGRERLPCLDCASRRAIPPLPVPIFDTDCFQLLLKGDIRGNVCPCFWAAEPENGASDQTDVLFASRITPCRVLVRDVSMSSRHSFQTNGNGVADERCDSDLVGH